MADITRRSAIALAASATAFPATAATAQTTDSRLKRLIANHTAAFECFEEACAQVDKAHASAFPDRPQHEHVFILRSRSGVSCFFSDELELNHEEALKRVCKAYDEKTDSVERSGLSDETKRTCLAELNANFEADRVDLLALYDAERARQEDHGLPQAIKAREEADRLEQLTGVALLEHPCLTAKEIALRADYLLSSASGAGGSLLGSIRHGDETFLQALLTAGYEVSA